MLRTLQRFVCLERGNFFLFFFSAWVLCRLTDLIERRVVRYAILGVRLVLEGFPIVQRCGGCPFSVHLLGLSTPSSDGAKMLSYLGPSNLLRLRVPLRLLLLFQISIAPIVSLIFVSTEAIFCVAYTLSETLFLDCRNIALI